MDKEEQLLEQARYNGWCENTLCKLTNVFEIKEFEPIINVCKEWLSERDETKFEKSNNELLLSYMNTRWIEMGWVEKFTCTFVTKFDLMEDNDKSKCWVNCVNKYLKNEYNKRNV